MRECAITIGASGSWFWACDECIKTGRAVEADVRKHNIGLGTSYAAYVDREFECTDCNQSFAFSATEQQYWFEELGFLIWVYPKQCAPCRHLRRRKKGLQKSIASKLHALDPSDPTELAALAELYELYGCETKAREFYARAQNKRIVADRSITESSEP